MADFSGTAALPMRGFMISLHLMHDFLPWFGPNLRGIELILEAMREANLNTLLFEYEAFFPWRGENRRISASNAFSEEEIGEIRRMAGYRGIELIPLVQVLGHVYHILIHEEYRACAEDPAMPQQLCPLAEETAVLARQLIDDTIALHPGCRYIHLGGDECRQLGVCPRCAEFVAAHGRGGLFSQYMRMVTDYALSRGVTPIIWHDIALRYPEYLGDFDDRVMLQYWNYGDASHGDAAGPLAELLSVIPARRVIVSPGARAERSHGALHHSPALIEANIRNLNQLAAAAGAAGTILTDWPDTGCSFFDSLYALRVQGDASHTGGGLAARFRSRYAETVFGFSAPELPVYLDAIAGATAFAPGFQRRQRHPLNRYDRKEYDFEAELAVVLRDYAECDGAEELYRLIARRETVRYFAEFLEVNRDKCRRNHAEYEWYRLLAALTEMFLLIDIGIRKECFVRQGSGKVDPKKLDRFQSRRFLREALARWDGLKAEYLRFHREFALEPNLERCADELFAPALKAGVERLCDSPAEVDWTGRF